jgi:hypothetical protein
MNIYEKTSTEPSSNLCNQSKIKECDGNCQYAVQHESSNVTIKQTGAILL